MCVPALLQTNTSSLDFENISHNVLHIELAAIGNDVTAQK